MDPQSPTRREAWSRYWSQGALHSCPGSFAGNYDDGIAAVWRSAWRLLPAAGSVIEIGCGNGALAQLFMRDCADRDARWTGIDLAALQLDWLAELTPTERDRIDLRAGVAAEALPFADASFDLAVSQYGLEYAGDAALTELQRVLKPGAAVCLITHHAASRVVELGREELAHHDWLGQQAPLLPAAAELLPRLALAATEQGRAQLRADPAANRVRAHFNEVQQRWAERIAASICPDLLIETRDAVAAVLQGLAVNGLQASLLALRRLDQQLEAGRLRSAELVECALDEAAMRRLAQRLELDSGYTLAPIAHSNGAVLGWQLSGRRRG